MPRVPAQSPALVPAAALAAALAAVLAGPACSPAPAGRPDVVLVVIDTLRADALGAYGHAQARSPAIDRLADEGVLYERIRAPSSWTKTSMASILTSRDPDRHGVRGVDDALPGDLATAAELFDVAGYRTIGVNTNPWLYTRFGFGQGFDSYETLVWEGGAEVCRQALARLDEARDEAPDAPVFLYVHLMDAHAPYTRHGGASGLPPVSVAGTGVLDDAALEEQYRAHGLDDPAAGERVRLLYDRAVGSADEGVATLVDGLRSRGRLDRAVLVVTSDHGEAFYEHGSPTHGRDLYPEVTRVPLIVRAPGRAPAGRRVEAQGRSIDILPTLLTLAGLPLPPDLDGRPLLPAAALRDDRVARSAVGGNDMAPDVDYVAADSGRYLYIRERLGSRVEFYDLRNDPGARHDLGAGHPEAAWHAARAGDGAAAGERAHAPEVPLDSETREHLRAMGYLHEDG